MSVSDEAVEATAELLCQELLFETPGHGCGGFCQAVGRYGPLARKVLAAAAPFLADGTGVVWRDISTAPKDGTEILLYGRCERDGHYYAADRNVGWWQADDECWQARDLPIDPTHWQPLPEPPSPKAED